MESILNELTENLKNSYKISISKNYQEVQDNILQAIIQVSNLENKIMENLNFPSKKKEEPVNYTLIHLDKNQNEFYIYPKTEGDFKKRAYEEGNVFVRAFHPNGHIEDKIRKVNRIWQSSVLWNINSMFSQYILNERGEECHFSKGKGLKVYACPISCKDSIPPKH